MDCVHCQGKQKRAVTRSVSSYIIALLEYCAIALQILQGQRSIAVKGVEQEKGRKAIYERNMLACRSR